MEQTPEPPKPSPNNLRALWNLVVNHQFIIYLFFFIFTFFYQTLRQNTIEARLADAENKAIHRTETNYAILMSGMLQSATIMETNLTEVKQHNILLIDCARKKNCSEDILVQKELRPYVPIAQHYFNVKQKMTEESEQPDVLDKH